MIAQATNKRSRTQEVLRSGLRQWVEDYNEVRKTRNVRLAKQIRDNILREIKRHDLDADEVWGPDPDNPKNWR